MRGVAAPKILLFINKLVGAKIETTEAEGTGMNMLEIERLAKLS